MSVRRACYCCALGSILAILLAGCGRGDPYARYIPDEGQALNALKACLEAWKHGDPAGPVAETSKPEVVVVDSWRESKQKLEGYQILGEVPGDTPRCYAIRLKLSDAAEEQRARFVVIGIDPLWVFRYEDFQLIGHWDHRMAEEQTAADDAQASEETEPTEAAESEPVPQ